MRFHIPRQVRSGLAKGAQALARGGTIAVILQAAWGQSWTCQNGACTTTANVGIGTTAPGYRLTVSGVGSNNSGQTDVQITGTGNVGGGINLISSDSGGKNWLILSTGSGTGIPGSLGLYDTSAGAYRFVVSSVGNVGIGTSTPQHLLHVAGIIGAEEVIVSSTGADYVFRPGYRLRPLNEVASYIKEHHHLPEIPSEAEVSKGGVSLGEMQAKLLAKIEELTLHMIRADQENRELRERVARLERER